MYIAPKDVEAIRNLIPVLDEYYEKFGEYFPSFNYDEWYRPGRSDAEVYEEILRNCIKEGKPYRKTKEGSNP